MYAHSDWLHCSWVFIINFEHFQHMNICHLYCTSSYNKGIFFNWQNKYTNLKSVVKTLEICVRIESFRFNWFNRFQPSVAFHIDTTQPTITCSKLTIETPLTLCVACFFLYRKQIKSERGKPLPKFLNLEKVWSWSLRHWCSFIRNNDWWGYWFGQVTNTSSADQNLIFDDVSLNKKWLGC